MTFINDDSTNPRPSLLTKIRAISVLENSTFDWREGQVIGCSTFSTSTQGGGALFIDSCQTILLDSISFANCTDKSIHKRNAIYLSENTNEIIISNCLFIDCFNYQFINQDQTTIYASGNQLVFNSNTITFTSLSNSCRCLYPKYLNSFEISNNVFSNAHSNFDGIGLYYENSGIFNRTIQIENNIFRNIEGCKGFIIYISSLKLSHTANIVNNMIEHCQRDNCESFFFFNFSDFTSDNEYIMPNYVFSENSGLTSELLEVSYPRNQYTLILDSCIFESNYYLELYTKMKPDLECIRLNYCTFQNNSNDYGSILNSTCDYTQFFDCLFINNSMKSGVITANTFIRCWRCNFPDNIGRDCHCIHILNSHELNMEWCYFYDNGSPLGDKPFILSKSRISVTNCKFSNFGTDLPCQWLQVTDDIDINLINSTFEYFRISTSSSLGFIYFSPSSNSRLINISECEFKHNQCLDSSILYLKCTASLLLLSHLVFEDNSFNKFLIKLHFTSGLDFSIFKFRFVNNMTPSKECGGSGFFFHWNSYALFYF